MFGLRKRHLIGLDIDASAVRMVRLQHGEAGYAVVGARVADIAPSGDNPKVHRGHTLQAMRECLAALGPDGGLAVCGVRGADVVVRGFEFPALLPEEIAGAVGLEASQICPFGTAESTLDFQVTSSDEKNTRGFWVAANNTLVRDTRQLVHEAGLHCTLVDVTGLALLNLHEAEDDGTSVDRTTHASPLLDIGDSCTTIAAADQAGRPFVRDIGFGGAGILTRIAAEAGMPFETVKAVLLEEEQIEEKDDALLQTCLEGACAGLIEDVATTLRYYAAQNNSMRVEKVLVCGGFAAMKGLIELLSTKLYLEAVLWNPLSRWPCEMGETWEPLLCRHGPGLAVAAGLAMRRL